MGKKRKTPVKLDPVGLPGLKKKKETNRETLEHLRQTERKKDEKRIRSRWKNTKSLMKDRKIVICCTRRQMKTPTAERQTVNLFVFYGTAKRSLLQQ